MDNRSKKPSQNYPPQAYSYPAQPYSGAYYPAQPYPGQTYSAQSYPTQQFAHPLNLPPGTQLVYPSGQPYPAQHYPTQQFAYPPNLPPGTQLVYPPSGQPYPAQSYPTQQFAYPSNLPPGRTQLVPPPSGQPYPAQHTRSTYPSELRSSSSSQYSPTQQINSSQNPKNVTSNQQPTAQKTLRNSEKNVSTEETTPNSTTPSLKFNLNETPKQPTQAPNPFGAPIYTSPQLIDLNLSSSQIEQQSTSDYNQGTSDVADFFEKFSQLNVTESGQTKEQISPL